MHEDVPTGEDLRNKKYINFEKANGGEGHGKDKLNNKGQNELEHKKLTVNKEH